MVAAAAAMGRVRDVQLNELGVQSRRGGFPQFRITGACQNSHTLLRELARDFIADSFICAGNQRYSWHAPTLLEPARSRLESHGLFFQW
jgi:hypothetical protein